MMMRIRKISVIILETLERLRKKGVRVWAFRDLFESTPIIYYIYRKDISGFIHAMMSEEIAEKFLEREQYKNMGNTSSIFYADNRSYFISS